MNRAAAVPFALLLGSAILAAQSASQPQAQPQQQSEARKAVVTTAPDGTTTWTTVTLSSAEAQRIAANTCPVALRAQQSAAAFSRQVDGAPQRGVAQRLHLNVTHSHGKRVVGATVTVRGAGNKARMVPVETTQGSSEAAKSFDVTFAAAPDDEPATDLWVPGFSAVSSIEVDSVTYSDGSMWKLAAGGSCTFLVDGMMLISAH